MLQAVVQVAEWGQAAESLQPMPCSMHGGGEDAAVAKAKRDVAVSSISDHNLNPNHEIQECRVGPKLQNNHQITSQ